MVDWARRAAVPALLVNAGVTLALSAAELFRLRHLTGDGLTFLLHNLHQGGGSHATRETHGINAVLFDGRHTPALSDSFLSVGQPFSGYWLAHIYAESGRRLNCVEFAAADHSNHPTAWDWEEWLRCAHEFARVTGWSFPDQTFEAGIAGSAEIRRRIAEATVIIDRNPYLIRPWISTRLAGAGSRVVLELGAHDGSDTAWLAALPGVTVHAFEPDPRNHPPPLANVVIHRAAIADRDGAGELILSVSRQGRDWTYSSSIRRPTDHLERYPVTFGESVQVELTTLDTFTPPTGSASSTSSGPTSRAPKATSCGAGWRRWRARATSTPSTPTTSCTRARCRSTTFCACCPTFECRAVARRRAAREQAVAVSGAR